jgi:hypothetical protein
MAREPPRIRSCRMSSVKGQVAPSAASALRAQVRNLAGRKLSKASSACAQGSAGTGSTSTGLGASTGLGLTICGFQHFQCIRDRL